MPEQKVGTREEWQAARDELAKIEGEQAQLNEEAKKKRRELPWVPVEKEYELDTEDGKKTLAELFDGRSQLLAYNVMFGPDYENGACPGCSSLADGLDGALVHLNHRDVTLICFSRAPIERLTAYKQRMGWQFPYVSTFDSDFAFDFGLALTREQAQEIPEVKELLAARTRTSILLVAGAAAAWAVSVERMRGMDAGPGTDLGGLGWYLGIWVTMTAAMMLPSAVPAAGQVARLARRNRTVLFVAGYLAVWTVYGLAAYGVYRFLSSLDTGWLAWDERGPWLAGAVIVAAGGLEGTPPKSRGLRPRRGAGHPQRP